MHRRTPFGIESFWGTEGGTCRLRLPCVCGMEACGGEDHFPRQWHATWACATAMQNRSETQPSPNFATLIPPGAVCSDCLPLTTALHFPYDFISFKQNLKFSGGSHLPPAGTTPPSCFESSEGAIPLLFFTTFSPSPLLQV